MSQYERVIKLIVDLINNPEVTNYRISKETGIHAPFLLKIKKKEVDIGNMRFENVMKLYEFQHLVNGKPKREIPKYHTMEKKIVELLHDKKVTNYRVAEDLGLHAVLLSNFKIGKIKIGHMYFKHAFMLYDYKTKLDRKRKREGELED